MSVEELGCCEEGEVGGEEGGVREVRGEGRAEEDGEDVVGGGCEGEGEDEGEEGGLEGWCVSVWFV